MKAITIWQPWAELIILGFKKIETRSWETNYRGRIAIHAGKFHRMPHEVYTDIAEAIGITSEEYWDSWLGQAERGIGVQFGAIIGSAKLVDVCHFWRLNGHLTAREQALGNFGPDRYGWIMENPIRCDPPIAMKGRQGLWETNGKEMPR